MTTYMFVTKLRATIAYCNLYVSQAAVVWIIEKGCSRIVRGCRLEKNSLLRTDQLSKLRRALIMFSYLYVSKLQLRYVFIVFA